MRASEIAALAVELQVISVRCTAVCSRSESEQGVQREWVLLKQGLHIDPFWEKSGAVRGSGFAFQ